MSNHENQSARIKTAADLDLPGVFWAQKPVGMMFLMRLKPAPWWNSEVMVPKSCQIIGLKYLRKRVILLKLLRSGPHPPTPGGVSTRGSDLEPQKPRYLLKMTPKIPIFFRLRRACFHPDIMFDLKFEVLNFWESQFSLENPLRNYYNLLNF